MLRCSRKKFREGRFFVQEERSPSQRQSIEALVLLQRIMWVCHVCSIEFQTGKRACHFNPYNISVSSVLSTSRSVCQGFYEYFWYSCTVKMHFRLILIYVLLSKLIPPHNTKPPCLYFYFYERRNISRAVFPAYQKTLAATIQTERDS